MTTKILNLLFKSNASEVNENVEELNDSLRDTKKGTEEVKNTVDRATGGMISKFKGVLSSIKNVISSFGLLRSAIIATGIGALVIAIVSLTKAFTASEEGQNRFAKALKTLGIIAGNVGDIFYNLGDVIYNVFTGNFDEAGKAFDRLSDKIVNFGSETRKEIKQAQELADRQAQLFKLERELTVQRAEANRKRADLLEKSADRENYTQQQRLEFLREAGRIEEDITNKEISAARTRLEIKQTENSFSESTREDLEEEANLKAELINLETAKLTKQKEVTGQISGLIEQEKALRKAAYDAEVAANKEKNDKILEAERQRLEEIERLAQQELNDYQKILDAETDYLDSKLLSDKDREIQANYDKYAELIALAVQYGEDTATLEEARLSKENEIKEKYRLDNDAKEKESNDAAKQREEELNNYKIQAVTNSFNAISDLATLFAGENEKQQERAFKVQKAVSTANALIDTYKSATGAYASLSAIPVVGPVLGVAAAGAAIAAGLANVKAIQSQNFTASGGSQANISAPSTPNATQQLASPNFNVVGASGVSQTESLGPVKAYVVSGDVTTAQALDRNRINNATF
jgi:hypothetical protein